MIDLAQSAQADAVTGQSPVLTKQGVKAGRYTLPPPTSGPKAIVTVSCTGAGRFRVDGDGRLLLDSACSGRANASILLPLTTIGTSVTVQAPGPFWIVIVPAR